MIFAIVKSQSLNFRLLGSACPHLAIQFDIQRSTLTPIGKQQRTLWICNSILRSQLLFTAGKSPIMQVSRISQVLFLNKCIILHLVSPYSVYNLRVVNSLFLFTTVKWEGLLVLLILYVMCRYVMQRIPIAFSSVDETLFSLLLVCIRLHDTRAQPDIYCKVNTENCDLRSTTAMPPFNNK